MATQLFSQGRVVMTFSLQTRLTKAIPDSWEEEIKEMINRHMSGDWGDRDQFDQEQNDNALKDGNPIFSAYHTSDGTKVWVITEGDRSSTTVLLPEDY